MPALTSLAPAAAALVLLLLAGRARADAALDDHAVELAGRAELAVGERGALSLTLTPRPGFRIAPGPLAIELAVEPPTGLAPVRRTLRGRAVADPRAAAPRFDLALIAHAPGDYAVAVVARFWVCGAHTCRPVLARRSARVRVSPPPPAPG